MDPVELSHFVTGLAKIAKHLAIQTHLVNPARIIVRRIQILGRRVRYADRPRLSLVRQAGRRVAQCRMPLLVIRCHHRDTALVSTFRIKNLNAPVIAIRYINIVLPVNSDVMRKAELARLSAARTPGFNPVAVFIQLRHARILVPVTDINVVFGIPGDIRRPVEIAVHMHRCRTAPARRIAVLVRTLFATAKNSS